VELAVVAPVLLLIVLFIIQVGVRMHAGHIAQLAAVRAAQAAAAYQASATSGEAAGRQTLAALGGGVLLEPTVSVTRTATTVRAQVDGTAETVVPGVHWHVRVVVERPVERFVPDPGIRS
jgi:Flp pilus assembly protein TadG